MNVAIFREKLLPASETFIERQAHALQRYRPMFIGVERAPGGIDLPAERTVVLDSGTRLGRVRVTVFRRSGRAPRLSRAIAKADVALIHAHFGPDGWQALRLARRQRLPLVTTFHGYDASWTDEALARSSAERAQYVLHKRELMEGAALHVAVSEAIRERLLAQGFPSEKVVVHYIGVDTQELRPNAEVDREDLVLFVGRMVEKKGAQELVRAMAVCRQQRPGVRVVFVGDGPLREEVRRLAGEQLEHAEFLGWQSPDAVRGLMSRARILCAPSVTASNGDSEGLPMAVCEAAALGTPTVGYRHSGIPEMVQNGRTGMLVPEKDFKQLGESILEVLERPVLWEAMSAASRARVVDHFDLQTQSARLERLYDRVVSANG